MLFRLFWPSVELLLRKKEERKFVSTRPVGVDFAVTITPLIKIVNSNDSTRQPSRYNVGPSAYPTYNKHSRKGKDDVYNLDTLFCIQRLWTSN